jgi:hypothetical protein
MASVNLSGVLLNPEGFPDVGAIVKFTLLTTTGDTVSSSVSELIVPPDGAYSVDIVYGNLRVDYISDFKERFVAIVTVNQDTTATSLPELLNAAVPPTNAQLLQFQAILADTVTAKNAAELAETGAVAAKDIAIASSIIQYQTFAELQAHSETVDYTQYTVAERANAPLTLQPSGYVALAGDATLSNGRVAALQIEYEMDVRKFGAVADGVTNDTQAVLDCALRSSFVTCDKNLTVLVSTVDILSGQRFKDIKFKLANGTNAECLSCERNSVGCEFYGVEIDCNKVNNAGTSDGIKVNGSTNCVIDNCYIYNAKRHCIGVFIGDDSNNNLKITNNTLISSDDHTLEVRGSNGLIITGNYISEWGTGSNGLEFQEPHNGVIVSNNNFVDVGGDLFAIESAGTPALVENFIISNNTLSGDYIGISGRFEHGIIDSNTFMGGVSTWRSGIELASIDVVVSNNFIDDGSISIASHGSTVPAYNARNIQILNNYVRNKGVDSKALYLGAASSATGTPTSTNIKISGNTFDFTQATGTGGRALFIGQYGLLSQIDGVDITDNVILGDGVTASTRGIHIDTLAGSGKVTVKGNRIGGFANNVNLTDDNLARFILRNNDLEDFITNAFLDASTTTVVTNQDNDV